MPFKCTPHYLGKIEQLAREVGFKLRYEKGSFQSGNCVLEEEETIVVNKFMSLENKISTLIDILLQKEIDTSLLSTEAQRTYRQISKLAQQVKEPATRSEEIVSLF